MPKADVTVYNNFTKGLHTEATGLNFPENSVTSSSNVVFQKSGNVRRRLGFDYEDSYSTFTVSTSGVTQTYLWETVGNDGSKLFAVAQVGQILYFYDVDQTALSDGKETFNIDLTSYKSDASITTAEVSDNRASMSSGDGFLFIAHRYCEPLYVEYDRDLNTITVNEITVKIRDFEGMDDGLEVDERPTGLITLAHEYNLQNQSWFEGLYDIAGAGTSNPLAYWDSIRVDYPSNSDVAWQFLDGNLEMNSSLFVRIYEGNSPAPKGHKIVEAFNIEREILYNATPPGSTAAPTNPYIAETVTTGNFRPEATEFYAGRVWWAGVRHPEAASKLYYSQVINGTDDFGKCYSQNDPTSRTFSDLLATDGGAINILDISNVIFLKAMQNSLFIFASNGIWSISGDDQSGFRADAFQVTKLSDIGVLSPYSFVVANNVPVWWSTTGIYTLARGEGGDFQVISLTNDSIRSFYEDIPVDNRTYAQGIYSNITRVITWVYRDSTTVSSFEDNFKYDRMLNFNIDTQAFYSHEIGELASNSPYIVGCINIQNNTTLPINENNTGEFDGSTRFLVKKGTTITWANERDTDYKDWVSEDSTGVSFDSSFTSGYVLQGQGALDMQSRYINVFSEIESDSGFFVSGYWDYAINTDDNRITTRQQGYSSKPNQGYSRRKLKLRGSGHVLQYRIESEDNKPFNISGVVTYDTVEDVV